MAILASSRCSCPPAPSGRTAAAASIFEAAMEQDLVVAIQFGGSAGVRPHRRLADAMRSGSRWRPIFPITA